MKYVANDYDDDDEREAPDESEMDPDIGDENAELVPCPYCGDDVYEQAERCPHCGKYISEEDTPDHAAARFPSWLIVGVIACLVAVLIWAMR